MIKSELQEKIAAKYPHLYQKDIERVLAAILDEIADALAKKDRVELRGFGAFSVKERRPRAARNPRTGSKVSVDAKYALAFRPGKEMRARLNPPAK
jgi:integration host factor subunit beta